MNSVYVLKCADGTLYTGFTTDVGRRIREHQNRVGAKYTRNRTPVQLMYVEHFRTRGTALRREAEIKSWSRERKLQLIKGG